MSKYRRRSHSIVEEPGFFLKHWWNGFATWAVENREQFITGVIAVLVIITAGLLWRRHLRSLEKQAWAAFGSPESVASLETAALNYAGTAAGPFLEIGLADMQLAQGRTDEALGAYRKAAERTEGGLRNRVLYSMARTMESAGRFDEAKDIYEDIAPGTGFWARESAKALESLEANREAMARIEEMKAEAAAEAKAAADEPDGGAEGEAIPAPGPVTDSRLTFEQPEETFGEPAGSAGAQ